MPPSAPALALGGASVAGAAILLAPGLNVPPVMMAANLLLSCACYLMTSKMSVAMRDTFIKVTTGLPQSTRASGAQPYQRPGARSCVVGWHRLDHSRHWAAGATVWYRPEQARDQARRKR